MDEDACTKYFPDSASKNSDFFFYFFEEKKKKKGVEFGLGPASLGPGPERRLDYNWSSVQIQVLAPVNQLHTPGRETTCTLERGTCR